MVTLIIVRHGYSKSNEQEFFTGQTDVSLAELGFEQARQTAEYIYKHFNIDKIYSSPLQRAYQTAEPLAKLCNQTITTIEALKEINGGEWEEKTPEQILSLYQEDYTLWLTDIGFARCTNGENMREVQLRAIPAMEKVAKENEGKTIALFLHAGVIRALQCVWQGVPISEMKKVPWVENASFSVVEYQNGKFDIRIMGYSDHLTTPKTNLPKNM